MEICFRPHHFLCALCFEGKGYSPTFIANFENIMTRLNSSVGDDVKIKVVAHTDSICHPCPNRNEKKCSSEEKILVLDNAHAAALKIKVGDIITWGEAKKLIAENIDLNKFHEICASCNWKELGICEKYITA